MADGLVNQPVTAKEPFTRRSFLGAACGAVVSLPVIEQVTAAAALAGSNASASAAGPQSVGEVDTFKPGTATLVLDNQALVLRDARGLWALSAVCTHKGSQVEPKDGQLFCGDHESYFDTTGKPVRGPAKKPLPWLALAIANGQVTVDLDKKVAVGRKVPAGGATTRPAKPTPTPKPEPESPAE